MAPKPPNARRAPAQPWRASITRGQQKWGPRHRPQTPQRSPRPGAAVARLDHPRSTKMGALTSPPNPPTLAAPRRSRGAPRSPAFNKNGGPDIAPKPPNARRAPAQPWRASITRVQQKWGPRHRPQTPQRSPRPGAAVARLDLRRAWSALSRQAGD